MASHNLKEYINETLKEKNWNAVDLVRLSGISASDISKYRKGTIIRLKAEVFYRIYTAFEHSCSKATKAVFPNLDLKINKYKPKQRNAFGNFMKQFETNINSLEEVAAKTGINENRLKELYYRKGVVEAYELLLIEKAVGKKQGELFGEIYS